jgi:hypothetical protein
MPRSVERWVQNHTQLLKSPSAPYVQFVLNPFNLLFGEIYSPTTVRACTERCKVRFHARIRALGAFSKNFRLRRFIQLPLKLFATFLARTMQARVRVIERGFQRMAVNGRPYLAVQTHVPPEDLVVSNSNQVITVLRITDAVQAHVITSALSHNILRVPIQRQPELSANRLTKTGSASREPATLRSNLSRFANYTGFIRAEGAHTANLKVFIHSVMTIQTAIIAAKTISTKQIKSPILRRRWCDLATREGYSEMRFAWPQLKFPEHS